MQKSYKLYIDDILESIKKIEVYINNISFEDFKNNSLINDAVVRNLEIIGEAVKNIPNEIRKNNPSIEWKKIAGLRDVLIHEYSGINFEILWDVVTNKIPLLKKEIQKIK